MHGEVKCTLRQMTAFPVSTGIVFLASTLVAADDVPFAIPPRPAPGQAYTSSVTRLGDIMGVTQLSHIKLWYAGRAENWQLTKYELARIGESLLRAALLYTNIPVEYVNAASRALGQLNNAAQAKRPDQFERSYSELTMACNACHVAGNVGFIRIKTPTFSPFSDEEYSR